jgi:hypothetical protein
MVTLQEQFEKDFPNKETKEISALGKYENSNFTNWDLDLRKYFNLECFNLGDNKITSTDFLNTLPNPEKLKILMISCNNIQPTNISVFSRFINLKVLKIGVMDYALKQGKRNQFYGSFKS